MEYKNVSVGIVSVFSGAFFLFHSSKLDAVPASFPRVIAGLLFVLGVVVLGRFISLQRKGDGTWSSIIVHIRRTDWVKELGIVPPLVLAILYSVLLMRIGFVISTPLLIGVTAYFFGYRKLKILSIVSMATSVLLYLIFGMFLNVPFPLFF